MELITVIGGGSWGSALSLILANNGNKVLIYDTDLSIVNEINTLHSNISKLPSGKLPENVTATSNLEEAVKFSNTIVLSVPTKVIRSVLESINSYIDFPKLFVNTSKGIEPNTFNTVSNVVYDTIDKQNIAGFVVLTGPSHAEEVIEKKLTLIASASNNIDDAKFIQKIFSNEEYFRVYTVTDLIGAELGGSIKNIYAIASGMLEGLSYGDNARAGLITRALVEMRRICLALGSNEDTIYGLTGVGDLIVTTTSIHSRNFQAGIKLAKGANLDEAISQMTMVVEGARTTLSAYQKIKELNIDAPIIEAVYNVIYLKHDVKQTISDLMKRQVKHENLI